MKTGKWALIGPGAVGLNYAAQLIDSGVELHVLARSDYPELQAAGIDLKFIDPRSGQLERTIRAHPARVKRLASEIGAADLIIVAAKSTFNESALESLRAVVADTNAIILTLQNGMGNAEFFAEHFPENPILTGLCFVCANRTGPAVVENYLPGRVEIGSLGDRWPNAAQQAVDGFVAAGIRANHAPVLDKALWKKLCWNIPFNGLSIAAGGITTDCVLNDFKQAKRCRILMEEVRKIAEASGHEISDAFIEGQFSVTAKMGAYRPSSLIDFLNGSAVEVESIWGEPMRRGQRLRVEIPELEGLYREIVCALKSRDAPSA